MLRYTQDIHTVLSRLRDHSLLQIDSTCARKFDISCDDDVALSFLHKVTSYAPLTDEIHNRLTVVANTEPNKDHPSWLGTQNGYEIHFYYPAFRNAHTLAFTFFHEYAHWIGQHLLAKATWDLYLEITAGLDSSLVWESFANDFAWFCTNRDYLSLVRPAVSSFFGERLELMDRGKNGK